MQATILVQRDLGLVACAFEASLCEPRFRNMVVDRGALRGGHWELDVEFWYKVLN